MLADTERERERSLHRFFSAWWLYTLSLSAVWCLVRSSLCFYALLARLLYVALHVPIGYMNGVYGRESTCVCHRRRCSVVLRKKKNNVLKRFEETKMHFTFCDGIFLSFVLVSFRGRWKDNLDIECWYFGSYKWKERKRVNWQTLLNFLKWNIERYYSC